MNPAVLAKPSSNQSSTRKVTRTVSKLTSSQLSRKRASDREAQRAARARTKDYIQRLERQVAELRSQRGRNHTIQDLRRRNTALENEIVRLLGNMGLPSFATPSEGVHVLYDSSRLDTASSCTSSSPACQPVTDHLDATMIHAARQEWQQNNWQNDGSYFPAITPGSTNHSVREGSKRCWFIGDHSNNPRFVATSL